MKRSFLLLSICILALSSCRTRSAKVNLTTSESVHNHQKSLDWQGLYSGSLPCPDCNGILTKLELNNDNSYSLERIYLGKSEQAQKTEGTFNWNKEGSVITLAHPENQKFRVIEGKLVQLDENGNRYGGQDADRYQLLMIDLLADQSWQLAAMNGIEIETAIFSKIPYIQFNTKENKASGFAGCNTFNGSYTKQGGHIKFDPMMSTKMACDQIDSENQFMNGLEESDTYTVSGNRLILFSKDKKPVLEFIAARQR